MCLFLWFKDLPTVGNIWFLCITINKFYFTERCIYLSLGFWVEIPIIGNISAEFKDVKMQQ